jgi:HD-GYP domain-containing protein (c-di-GMP phosphodiesterase class II)
VRRTRAGRAGRGENGTDAYDQALKASNVNALLSALQARDGDTENHSQAVVTLAVAVGRELHLGERQLLDLESVALLHDIGKIGIPDAILRKPGKLSDEQWAEMHRHPDIGADIVATMPSLSYLAPVIRAEHERWDGGGYPVGLQGEDIPLLSRIVFVCDAYHAMTSDRPYRRALKHGVALKEIKANSGSQFCPRAAAALARVLQRTRARPARAGGLRTVGGCARQTTATR